MSWEHQVRFAQRATLRTLVPMLRRDLEEMRWVRRARAPLPRSRTEPWRTLAWRVLVLQRLQEVCTSHRGLRPLFPILHALQLVLHGCDIHIGTRVGAGLTVIHPHGTVIGGRFGDRVKIAGNCTVGYGAGPDLPVIEDDVELGIGCRVLGGVRVGRGAQIGANAVVTKDVPPGAVVAGVPGRVLDVRPYVPPSRAA